MREVEGQMEQIIGIASRQNEQIFFKDVTQPKAKAGDLIIHPIIHALEQGMIDGVKESIYRALHIIRSAPQAEAVAKLIAEVPAQCIIIAY